MGDDMSEYMTCEIDLVEAYRLEEVRRAFLNYLRNTYCDGAGI